MAQVLRSSTLGLRLHFEGLKIPQPQRMCSGQNPAMTALPSPPDQPRNPLHGVTLEAMVTALHTHFGWADLALRIPIRCFTHEPSVNSSLKFLRKTPWAREKVEGLYLFMLREKKRSQGSVAP